MRLTNLVLLCLASLITVSADQVITTICSKTATAMSTITNAPSFPAQDTIVHCNTTTSNCYYQYKTCNDVMTFVSNCYPACVTATTFTCPQEAVTTDTVDCRDDFTINRLGARA
ncbi:hypothetical protein SUNI508_01971 [Seiridium unicorne]|uniref:ShKT domain-containing protein n=1 Tax=Seiridium unicorne TaxID=138068 RepID=A0ABR2UKV7_9PEZI